MERLERSVPPAPPEGYADLPIEEWVARALETGPAPYGEEELMYRWLEDLPARVGMFLWACIAEARGEPMPGVYEPAPGLPGEVVERAVEAIPPHVERARRVFAEARPQREAKRRMREEEDARRGKRYGSGREWLREWDLEREELARKYDGWEQEWALFYAEWLQETKEAE